MLRRSLRRSRILCAYRPPFGEDAQNQRVLCDLIFGKGSPDSLQTWNIGERQDDAYWKGLTTEAPPSTIWTAIRGRLAGAEDDRSKQICVASIYLHVRVICAPKTLNV